MLPFFFRHYDPLVDRYFIYDDGSTDRTLRLLEMHPRVEVASFPRSDTNSFVLSEQYFSNQCWKNSIGRADWVIVTDIDEHLIHARWHAYLSRCAEEGVTLVPALGFQMISEKLPNPEEFLCDTYTLGMPWLQMMKASIFNPNAINEINFSLGRHSASPEGAVSAPKIDETLLLHYKYIGFEETLRRHRFLRTGLRNVDMEQGWGHKYSWSEQQLRADWDEVARMAEDVRPYLYGPRPHYPIRPWWDKYRR